MSSPHTKPKPSARRARASQPSTPAAKRPPDDGSNDELLDRLFARTEALSPARRAYFEHQQPADRAAALGARSAARDTVRAALKVYVQVADAASRHPKLFAAFSPALRRWSLEQLVALRDAVAALAEDADRAEVVSAALRHAMVPARVARNELVAPLALYVEGDDDDEARLAAARGDVSTPGGLVASLRALAKLAGELLARRTEIADVAAEESGLSADHASDARDAADALQRAIDDDTAAGRKPREDQDSPAMNVIEGRVALSLRRMRQIHASARAKDPSIAALEIPPALQRVLGSSPRPAPSAKKRAEPAPA